MSDLETRFWVECLAFRWAFRWGVWLRGALLGGVFDFEMGFGVGVSGLEVRFWVECLTFRWALGWGCFA